MTYEELQERINQIDQEKDRHNGDEVQRMANEVLEILDNEDLTETQKQKLRSDAIRYLGIAASLNHKYASAVELLRQSLSIVESLDDKLRISFVYERIGTEYYHMSDYPRALDYYYKSLELAESQDDKDLLATVISDIGLLYMDMGEHQRALSYYMRALAIAEEEKSLYGITIYLGNIGNIYGNLGDNQKSLEYFQRGLAIAEQINKHRSIIAKISNIGRVYQNMKDYSVSMEYFHRALALSEQHGFKAGIGVNLCNIAANYANPHFDLYNLQKSLEYYLHALSLFDETNSKKQQFNTHKNLAEIYKRLELWKEHSYHFEKYHEIEKEVLSEETKRLAEKYDYERQIAEQEKKIEIELARNEEILRQHDILEEQAAKIQIKNTELHQKNIELNTANRQLEEAGNFKMKILGIASHDLKNPIAGINLSAEMLLRDDSNSPRTIRKLKMITSASKRMLEIIVNLMDVAARQLGQIKLTKSLVNIAEIVSEVSNEYLLLAAEKSQSIEFFTEGDCSILADEQLLRQVFDNLISNAVKYSEHEKAIKISVIASQNNVTIAVADQGQGLSEEDKTLLFNDFQKLSARPTGGEGSTGLGLSVVKNLVELHGGKVWAESEGKGMGSTFFVELPVL